MRYLLVILLIMFGACANVETSQDAYSVKMDVSIDVSVDISPDAGPDIYVFDLGAYECYG